MIKQIYDRLSEPGEYDAVILSLIVFCTAIVTRLAHLDAAPFYDELYHVLAARSWVESGTLAIADGAYTRSSLYTYLTAWTFDLTGTQTTFMARAPNVLLGALLASFAVLWTYTVAGRIAAAVVACLVIFWPSGIMLSQFARFYAVHGILFFLASIATYTAFLPGAKWQSRAVMGVTALICLWGALQFQESTMVGALFLLAWIGLVVILPAIWQSPYRWILLAGLAVAGLCVIGAAFGLGIVQNLWTEYRETPWDTDPTAYNRIMRDTYPLFWSLTPLLAVAALGQNPRPAGFCIVICTIGLIIHSFAGVQNVRYIYYFSPFLFALWGMGIQAVFPTVLATTQRTIERLVGSPAPQLLVVSLVTIPLVFAFVVNSAVQRSVKLALGAQAAPFVPRSNWANAKDRVAELRDGGAVVVTHNDLLAIEMLGGLDLTYSENWLPEMNGEEFAIDPRTGAPLIAKLSSLELVVKCSQEGVFITDGRWKPPSGFIGFFAIFQIPGVSYEVEALGPVRLIHWTTDVDHAGRTATCAENADLLSR